MPSSIQSFAEFESRLKDAMTQMDAIIKDIPDDPALVEIRRQLDLTSTWTQGGTEPTLAQKGDLNFGLLASKYVSDIDDKVAENLYELASYITYWP